MEIHFPPHGIKNHYQIRGGITVTKEFLFAGAPTEPTSGENDKNIDGL